MTMISPDAPGRAALPRTRLRGQSTAEIIHRVLRDDILSLKLKPGEALSEKRLGEQFGVSRTPVREAVLRLSDEKLVDVFPQSGTYVSRIPLQAVKEANIIRKALEEAAIRHAASVATPEGLAIVREALALQRRHMRAQDAAGFHAADEAFHAAIADVAGLPGLWAVVRQAKMQVDRCRMMTLPEPGRMGKVIAEHEAIFDALAARDAAKAATCLDAHLSRVLIDADALSQLHPDYFLVTGKTP
jgi:DNA-binding GntR family transcriptional regulator